MGSGVEHQAEASMHQAHFRFYAELNDFLPPSQQHTTFQHRYRGNPAVKDIIEALGPPHTEIELILVNGMAVGFDHALQHGDRVSAYPRFRSLDITTLMNVRPPQLQTMRFVLDSHLGRLAAYMRMLGFDSLYWNRAGDEHLARISHQQRRILLTRDRGLLKRNAVTYGYCVRQNHPRDQLHEVVDHFDLKEGIQPFKRCMRCNGILQEVEKETVMESLPEGVRASYEDFRHCPGCGRVYWRGSHFARMQQLIEGVLHNG